MVGNHLVYKSVFSHSYGPSVDIWSCGCVLAEMLTSTPLFAGETSAGQLVEIVTLLGAPQPSSPEDVSSKDCYYFDEAMFHMVCSPTTVLTLLNTESKETVSQRLEKALVERARLAEKEEGENNNQTNMEKKTLQNILNCFSYDPRCRPTAKELVEMI